MEILSKQVFIVLDDANVLFDTILDEIRTILKIKII